jgi:hypothetical protein
MMHDGTRVESWGRVLERWRWRWRLVRGSAGLGLPGIAGLVVLVATLWVVAIDIPQVQSEVRQIKQSRMAAASVGQVGAQQPKSIEALPRVSRLDEHGIDISKRLPAVILASLRDSGVTVQDISIAETDSDRLLLSDPIRQLDLSIVVEGAYPALRRGLDIVMREHPSLAMTSMILTSETERSAARSSVQATVRMRYYLLPAS